MRILLALLALIASAASAQLGPLTPPAGPISETGPDLGQLEPRIPVTDKTTPGGAIGLFEITRPGSYFLTGDLQMPGGDQRSAIAISTNDVTLDLNGFRLSGAGDSVHGIEVRGSRVRIRDGFIFRFGRDGINASPGSFNVSGIVVEDVMTQANNRSGIVVDHGRVARCRSIGNGGSGIVTGPSSVVESVESSSNLGAGVEMSTDGVLRDSTASLNKAAGFSFAVNGVAAGSHAANNAGSGFDFALGGSATDSTARGNGGRGFRVQDGEAAFESCVAEDNTLEGFLAAGPASIRDCDAIDNEGDGISVGDGSSIESSRARWNSLDGFRINGSASVVGCLATENFGDGYEFVEQFFFMTQRVETSVARNNSGVGVRAEGFGVIVVTDSQTLGNGEGGFLLGDFATIERSTASVNGRHGIAVGSYSTVRDNTAQRNGSVNSSEPVYADIFVAGVRSLVDGNSIVQNNNELSIWVTLGENTIIRNVLRPRSGAVEVDIAAGNRVGEFIRPASQPAISGAPVGQGQLFGVSGSYANIVHP